VRRLTIFAEAQGRRAVFKMAGNLENMRRLLLASAIMMGVGFSSVQAKGKAGEVIGFVVNETLMVLADRQGKAPDDRFSFKAY
jgi:hypothetical protein